MQVIEESKLLKKNCTEPKPGDNLDSNQGGENEVDAMPENIAEEIDNNSSCWQ